MIPRGQTKLKSHFLIKGSTPLTNPNYIQTLQSLIDNPPPPPEQKSKAAKNKETGPPAKKAKVEEKGGKKGEAGGGDGERVEGRGKKPGEKKQGALRTFKLGARELVAKGNDDDGDVRMGGGYIRVFKLTYY